MVGGGLANIIGNTLTGGRASGGGSPPADPALILKYVTTTPSESIEIRGGGTLGYNYDVDWGDSSSDTSVTTNTKTHTYSVAGTYTVKITGAFPHPHFGVMSATDREKIVELSNWGDIQYTKLHSAFSNCINMEYAATDTPDLSAAAANTGNMMRFCFNNCTGITNPMDLSNWTNLECIGNFGLNSFLLGATNVPYVNMSGWNMPNNSNAVSCFTSVGSNLTNGCDFILNNMTWGAVTGLNSFMFGVKIKTLSINNWTLPTSGTLNISSFLYNATANVPGSIDLDLSGWTNTARITIMTNFLRASSVTSSPFSSINTTGWDTSNISALNFSFYRAAYLTDIIGLDGWKGDSVTTLQGAWEDCRSLNFTNYNFDTTLWGNSLTNLTGNMSNCFLRVSSNNAGAAPNITNWNTSNVTNMQNLFFGVSFTTNPDISTWDFSSVTNLSQFIRDSAGITSATFNNISSACVNFNSKIRGSEIVTIVYNSNCDLSAINTYTHYAFNTSSLVNQTFDSGASFAAVTTFANAWNGTSMNTASYDVILVRCEATNSNTIVGAFGANNTKYTKAPSAAETARAALIADHGWTFSDDGPTP
tara:strand:+ start:2164 stop:3933 length:1770 start_codon:yes stop_codon:yes gene_type:complete